MKHRKGPHAAGPGAGQAPPAGQADPQAPAAEPPPADRQAPGPAPATSAAGAAAQEADLAAIRADLERARAREDDLLRALVSLLAERERITRVLQPAAGSPGVRITIGRENGPGAMGGCSVVAAGIDRSGLTGSLAVLGPVRMPYARLVSLVSFVRGRLSERA